MPADLSAAAWEEAVALLTRRARAAGGPLGAAGSEGAGGGAWRRRRVAGASAPRHQERWNFTWLPLRSNQPRKPQLIQPPSPLSVNSPDSKTQRP